jgi:hypothetical protein
MSRTTQANRRHRVVSAAALTITAAALSLTAVRSPGQADRRVTRYLIVAADSQSGSWDSRDEPQIRAWRSKYGNHFAWFRQDDHDYIVTDEGTLKKLDDAMAPQLEVNRQQGEVNAHQAQVNRLQADVNSHQQQVNRAQSEVNRQQSLANRGAEEQSVVNDQQAQVNRQQHGVNGEQEKVNREQAVVNQEQSVVNAAQTRASTEIREALQIVFDSARTQGVARQVR